MPQPNKRAQQAQGYEQEVLEFDQITLPWVDRDSFHMELDQRLTTGRITPDEAQLLRQWHDAGDVIFETPSSRS